MDGRPAPWLAGRTFNGGRRFPIRLSLVGTWQLGNSPGYHRSDPNLQGTQIDHIGLSIMDGIVQKQLIKQTSPCDPAIGLYVMHERG